MDFEKHSFLHVETEALASVRVVTQMTNAHLYFPCGLVQVGFSRHHHHHAPLVDAASTLQSCSSSETCEVRNSGSEFNFVNVGIQSQGKNKRTH